MCQLDVYVFKSGLNVLNFSAKGTITSRLRDNQVKFIRALEQTNQEIMKFTQERKFSEKRQDIKQ